MDADAALDAAVRALIRRVAAEVVMPRFGRLAAADIAEKAPDDLVTIADRESEARLSEGLRALIPGATVVGEEATAAEPALIDGIANGTVWIVDPIDGTGNYAAGRSPFALMVALAEGGETRAGWIFDPVADRMCHAWVGGGAFVDGVAVRARGTGRPQPVAALAPAYLPPATGAAVIARAAGRLEETAVPRCAGEQYPRVVLGANDAALFWRALPWDHAPGALFLTEAGGRIAHADGAPYRPADRRHGLLAAATPALWDGVAAILFADPLPDA